MTSLSRRTLLAGTAAAVATPALAQPVPANPVTLQFFGLASYDWAQDIDKFQAEYPNIKVMFTKFGTDDLKQALRVGASSGKLPDLWWNWGGSLASPYNRAGHTVKITPEIMQDYKIDGVLNQTFVDAARDGGDLYGVPHKIGPFTFIYKKALFEQNGISVPKSFADLENAAAVLKGKKIVPFSNGGKFSWMTMRYFDFLVEHFAGSQGHDDLLELKTPWTSEPVIQAFTKLKEWADKGYFPNGFLNTDPATTTPPLYNNQAAMVFDTISLETSRFIRDGMSVNDFGTFPLPTDQPRLRVPGSPAQIQVNAHGTEDVRRAALLFATWVVRPANAPTTALITGFPSATKGVLPGADLPIQRQWAEWTAKDVGFYRLSDQGLPQEVVAAFFEGQDSVLLNTMSPKEAGAQVQEAITRYKRRNG